MGLARCFTNADWPAPFCGGNNIRGRSSSITIPRRGTAQVEPKIDVTSQQSALRSRESPSGRYSRSSRWKRIRTLAKHEPMKRVRTGISTVAESGCDVSTSALLASVPDHWRQLGMEVWKSELSRVSRTNGIAVLPLENLSPDQSKPTSPWDKDEDLNALAIIGIESYFTHFHATL